ncbi:MAG: alpha-L-rhamnosidase N-terminal domain-containing protein, partial [Muribaculaceae bacterium]|nr:alpha-L-rhamnosidase N-terminal domain-containing protein [Muribaculaceae bacterium]
MHKKIYAFGWAVLSAVGVLGGVAQNSYTGNSVAQNPFEGAEWISVEADSMPLYPDYLSVFRIGFNIDMTTGNSASFLFGIDDPRLMDPNKNVYGLKNGMGESYLRLQIEEDSLKLFRSGYTPTDNASIPLVTIPVDNFRHANDSIEIAVNYGNIDFFVNGKKVGSKGVNPFGNGGDYIAYPVLGKVAVDIPETSRAEIRDITVSNFRDPRNAIAKIMGKHNKTESFTFPQRSMPEMRATIGIDPQKELAKVTVNATARGIYDLYLNGDRVNDEYFLPGSTQYNKTHLYHSFDLTDIVCPGDNELRVRLGEGWWSGPSTFMGEYWNFFGDRQAFLAAIDVEYSDG